MNKVSILKANFLDFICHAAIILIWLGNQLIRFCNMTPWRLMSSVHLVSRTSCLCLNEIVFSTLIFPATIYVFKVTNNRNTRQKCETCSKSTIKTPKQQKMQLKTEKKMQNQNYSMAHKAKCFSNLTFLIGCIIWVTTM